MLPILRLFDGYEDTTPQYREYVVRLQKLLNVPVDGHFGPITEQAVTAFQNEHGLTVDGIVGKQTWAALLGDDEPASDYETVLDPNNGTMLACLEAAREYREAILKAAELYTIDPAIIFGIGVRESHWGRLLKPKGPAGTGDFILRKTPRPWRSGTLPPDGGGYGRGLMQIDYDAHKFARGEEWKNPTKNIGYGVYVLFVNLRALGNIAHALAAYNCGIMNVRRAIKSGRDHDYYTHGRDYSKAVLDYAGWFQLIGGF